MYNVDLYLHVSLTHNCWEHHLYLICVITGAAAAAKVYLDSLSHVAKQAQQGTCGGTADIGNKTFQLSHTTYMSLRHSLGNFHPWVSARDNTEIKKY